MKIGTTPIVSVKSGTTPIQKVYSGVNLIWSSVDPDAQAFITAASITDPTQQSAINQLVVDLKGYGVWTKMKALYPFVGGTAISNSYNLKNTAQYQITWNGGITHSSTGVTFNGTNGYGNTGLNQLSVLTQNSQHISFYSRTNTDGNFSEIGLKSTATSYTMLQVKYSNAFIAPINEFYNFADNSANANGQGFYVGNRTAATVRNNWKNGSKVHTSSSTSQTQANFNFFIGALNNAGSVSAYTNKQCAFASIGDGLTDTEAANFYTAVQTFQTSLNRQVGTPIPSTGYLLNDYPDATAAYSLRKLSSSATLAIRVRRTSDNAEQNIGFDGVNLDTSSLLSFVGASNGYVTTWYDQSGNTKNIIRTFATQQPLIVMSGSLLLKGSKPCVKFDGTDDLLALNSALTPLAFGNQFSIFNVHSSDLLNTIRTLWCNSSSGSSDQIRGFGDTRTPTAFNWFLSNSVSTSFSSALSTVRNNTDQRLQVSVMDSGNVMRGFDNGATGGTSTYTGTYSNNNFIIGSGANGSLNGTVQEFIIYNTTQLSNRIGIEDNINNFYLIY